MKEPGIVKLNLSSFGEGDGGSDSGSGIVSGLLADDLASRDLRTSSCSCASACFSIFSSSSFVRISVAFELSDIMIFPMDTRFFGCSAVD